jgi:adenylate kinase
MNVVLLGPPGSGKGTQGQRLADRLGLTHIATGDLLRGETAAGTPLGRRVQGYLDRGELVPDEVIIDLVLPMITEAVKGNGYVLDGFPRSVSQAQSGREMAEKIGATPNLVVYLDVPTEALVERLLARAQIEGRSDDTHDVIANRLQVFDDETRPLIDYYRGRGLLHIVDADRPEDDVTAEILSALGAGEAELR